MIRIAMMRVDKTVVAMENDILDVSSMMVNEFLLFGRASITT